MIGVRSSQQRLDDSQFNAVVPREFETRLSPKTNPWMCHIVRHGFEGEGYIFENDAFVCFRERSREDSVETGAVEDGYCYEFRFECERVEPDAETR